MHTVTLAKSLEEYFPWPYSGSLKLENVTFEDSKEELTVSMIHGSTLRMVEFHGINILKNGHRINLSTNSAHSALCLKYCNVIFMTIHTPAEQRYGTICAENAGMSFQGNVIAWTIC